MQPVELAEQHIKKSILSGIYREGDVLPNQNILANEIGVNRSTLRVAMIALHSDKWVKMCHGKPTTVRNFQEEGTLNTATSRVSLSTDNWSRELHKDALKAKAEILALGMDSSKVINLVMNDLDRLLNACERN
ncbi:GntR family transcriptional regulator [Vibrio cholerae]|nr:GntR family transcriptional regulator [Vibrio cholerae]